VLTRIKKGKLKVLVTCTLTIIGLGCHAGSGEEWADEENAMTESEAQAFKRQRAALAWDVTFASFPRPGCR
jgi:hypothetical protein